jgi:VWFA-related protein
MSFIPSGARAAIVTCLVCVFVALAFPVAQQPPPTFRAGVEAVVLDVSVLDKDRRPVRGLTAADFTILEDGKAQDIRTFKAIDMEDVVEALPAPWVREVAQDVRRNDEFKDHRVVLIVMDSSTPMPAADVMLAKRLARSAVDQLAPDDLAAVVFTFDRSAGQLFTRDRARLRAAIDRFNGSMDNTWGMDKYGRVRNVPFYEFNESAMTLYQSTLSALSGLARDLAELPERRKALILVSVGLPIDASLAAPDVAPSSGDQSGKTADLLHDLREALAAAQRANVSIYSLDPGGLRTVASPLNQDFLRTVSDTTGGFVVVDTNDPAPGIAQIYRENRSYYLLGYQSANGRTEGRVRKLEVQVNRPGVIVRARNSYIEPTRAAAEKAATARPRPAPAAAALTGLLPVSDIALQVHAVPFAKTGGNQAEVAIVVQGRHSIPKGSTATTDNVEVLIHAYDMQARSRASERLNVRLATRPGLAEGVRYNVLSRLSLEPGRYQLRLAARSAGLDKTGSVYCDLDVPDFSKAALSLSGVMLEVTPSIPAAPKGRLSSLIPIVPSVQRDFVADEQVGAFVRVYQGGKDSLLPVLVTTQIVDGRNADVFTKRETLRSDRFAVARAADYRVSLPIADLSKEPHLLRITVTRGTTTAQREVRFTVH